MLCRGVASDICLIDFIATLRVETLDNLCLHIYIVRKLLKTVIGSAAIDCIIRLKCPRNTLTLTLIYNLDNQLFIKRSNLYQLAIYRNTITAIADHIFKAELTHIVIRHCL